MVSDIVIFESDSESVVRCPCGEVVFIAVMQGSVLLTTVGDGVVPLAPCSVIHCLATAVSGLSVGEGTRGLAWAVNGVAALLSSRVVPYRMDELAAIVIQDAAFDSPRQSGTLQAALDYLSLRAFECEQDFLSKPVSSDGQDERVSKALQLMAASLDSPMTLTQLSRRLDCSGATLSRLFKLTGLPSPMRYFAKLRVEHAKSSLQQSELSISNIAASLGFRDLATFSHFFRQHTGHCPRDYRLNCRWLL